MKKRFILALAGSAVLLAACVSNQPRATGVQAQLQGRSGSSVSGMVTFAQAGEQLRVEVDARDVPPGEHGFHIHAVGDCSAPDASSAKGHYDPIGKPHGHFKRAEHHHAGDLPNLVANGAGVVSYSAYVEGVTLAEIVGKSVIVHADPDDYVSQPAGNSGKRIACGVITGKAD